MRDFRGRQYQPLPFPEYRDIPANRFDCSQRYGIIKPHIDEIVGKTLLDLCCANGYFAFRFLQDGGKSAVGVEDDNETRIWTNDLAIEKGMDFKVYKRISEVTESFDVCFYLDTHYNDGTKGYLEFVKERCKLAFISPAQNGVVTSPSLHSDLKVLWNEVTPISTGYEARTIFKCR